MRRPRTENKERNAASVMKTIPSRVPNVKASCVTPAVDGTSSLEDMVDTSMRGGGD